MMCIDLVGKQGSFEIKPIFQMIQNCTDENLELQMPHCENTQYMNNNFPEMVYTYYGYLTI